MASVDLLRVYVCGDGFVVDVGKSGCLTGNDGGTGEEGVMRTRLVG